ncbi:hypothetical protein C8R46DRAFT_873643, partial [Mycena filopes]
FSPTPADLLAARDALLSLLPLELVDIILHVAEYWVQDTTQCAQYEEIDAEDFILTSDTSVCYLLAAPIRPLEPDAETSAARLKIMCVVFTTVSHDQGWGGEDGTQGTYCHSYTWFEAAILR